MPLEQKIEKFWSLRGSVARIIQTFICIFRLHCSHLCFSDPLNNLRWFAQTKTFPGLVVRCQGPVNVHDSLKFLQLGSGWTQHGIWGLLLVFFLYAVPYPVVTLSAEAWSALKTDISFVGFILEEFGGWLWEEEYSSCSCGCDWRDKKRCPSERFVPEA